MRDYQREKNNQYHLPKDLYRQTLYLIRDYYRLIEEYGDMIDEGPDPENVCGGGPGDPTGALAVRLESVHDRVTAIEKAKKSIPEEYIPGIWKNIIWGSRYPDDANRSTYGRWKARFVYQVAKNMHWI